MFFDGAIYVNNPVRIANTERRLLWPDVADAHADILLSLGTGKSGRIIEAGLRKGYHDAAGSYGVPCPRWGRLSRLKTKAQRKVTKTKTSGLVSRYFEVAVSADYARLSSQLMSTDQSS